MKKFTAFVLVLAMALTMAAFAESTETAAETYDISGIEIPADWVQVDIADRGISFYVPADMNVEEPDATYDQLWHGTNDDMDIVVGSFPDAASWDDIDAIIAGYGYNCDANVVDFGYDHKEIYDSNDANYNCLAFIDGNGNYCGIECYNSSDDAGSLFLAVLKSLTVTEPVTAEESAGETAEEVAGETAEISDADWVQVEFAEHGLTFLVPSGMEEQETDEESGLLWGGANDDILIYAGYLPGITTEDGLNAMLTEAGFTIANENRLELGFDHMECTVSVNDTDISGIIFQDNCGDYWAILGYLYSDNAASSLDAVLGTIQLTEPAVTSETAESSIEG